jgi:hypothetical protein
VWRPNQVSAPVVTLPPLTDDERREAEDELEQAHRRTHRAHLRAASRHWKTPLQLEAHDRHIARLRRMLTRVRKRPAAHRPGSQRARRGLKKGAY